MTTKTAALEGIEGIVASKIVANNTFEYNTEDGRLYYRLHMTDIMVFRPDGSIVLDTGGWKTSTTKERMNRFLPKGISVWQSKGRWFLGRSHHYTKGGYVEEWVVPYFDGVVIPSDYSRPVIKLERALDARNTKILKQIGDYCVEVKKLIADGKLPLPSGGDCWICLAESGQDLRDSGGDPTRNNSHILEHLREKYVHGWLIYNAIKWAGYDPKYTYGGWNTVRCVRRYLKFRTGLPS